MRRLPRIHARSVEQAQRLRELLRRVFPDRQVVDLPNTDAICHTLYGLGDRNQSLGGSWEHADDPEYSENFTTLGIRIAVNYINYAMTH